MYQLAAIVFIVAAGGGAAYLSQRPTIASSAGLEQVLRDSNAYGTGYKAYACDDNVPIGVDGARYHCTLTNNSGDTEHLSCTIYRSGSFKCVLDDAERVHRVPASGDTWQ